MCALLAVRVSWASLLRGKERDAAVGAASEGAPAPCPALAGHSSELPPAPLAKPGHKVEGGSREES